MLSPYPIAFFTIFAVSVYFLSLFELVVKVIVVRVDYKVNHNIVNLIKKLNDKMIFSFSLSIVRSFYLSFTISYAIDRPSVLSTCAVSINFLSVSISSYH